MNDMDLRAIVPCAFKRCQELAFRVDQVALACAIQVRQAMIVPWQDLVVLPFARVQVALGT